jgi:hypothetical protein
MQMRLHFNRLLVAAGVLALAAAFGPVAAVSAASASRDAAAAPTVKTAEEGIGTIDFGRFQGFIEGKLGTFREQCVAHSDGRPFATPASTRILVLVKRSGDAVCEGRPTESTWFVSVDRPVKGLITFRLSQERPGGEYRINCEEATGNVSCRTERDKIVLDER